MAGTLKFKVTDDFRKIVEHAANNDPGLFFGEKIDRSLLLVKDQGVYLMSAGQPRLLKNPEEDKDKKFAQGLVQYAEGLNPEVDDFDDWYEDARRICGGDDFGEPIGVDFFQRALADGAKEITIKLTATSFTVNYR